MNLETVFSERKFQKSIFLNIIFGPCLPKEGQRKRGEERELERSTTKQEVELNVIR